MYDAAKAVKDGEEEEKNAADLARIGGAPIENRQRAKIFG
jgi:hypothetical protein